MDNLTREKYLRVALVVAGLAFIAGLPLMMYVIWPEGWGWTPAQYEFEQMILGVYATLGVFLLIASRNPAAHTSLIWFTIWSSAVHAAIMAAQAIVDPTERANLLGDVTGLFLIAIVLTVLMPKKGSHSAA